jgi:hypothetical protein
MINQTKNEAKRNGRSSENKTDPKFICLFVYLFLKKEYFNVTLKVIKIDLFI